MTVTELLLKLKLGETKIDYITFTFADGRKKMMSLYIPEGGMPYLSDGKNMYENIAVIHHECHIRNIELTISFNIFEDSRVTMENLDKLVPGE